ncbi:Endogenous retrovirus group K member 18 Pol protein [Frankliniella fusca]|uniref:Endogenous retrovirus group K member 18 Pol protein n=1 Tax=Frankliniella fusca TaxID=407009 RepID=A0AAE1HJF0_9NEOP|nr:Endogenous retrovirus group K member 18 Pol protein [Frankliniella fusca]
MAGGGGSSTCTFSPAGASRQSLISFQKRLSGGRRSMQALGPLGGPLGGVGAGGITLRPRGGLARRHAPRLQLDGTDVTPRSLHDVGFAVADDRQPVANAWELLTGLGAVGVAALPPMGPLGPGVHSAPSTSSGIMVTRDSSIGGTSVFGGLGLGLGPGASVPASSALSVLSVCDPEDLAPSPFVLPRPTSLKVTVETSRKTTDRPTF